MLTFRSILYHFRMGIRQTSDAGPASAARRHRIRQHLPLFPPLLLRRTHGPGAPDFLEEGRPGCPSALVPRVRFLILLTFLQPPTYACGFGIQLFRDLLNRYPARMHAYGFGSPRSSRGSAPQIRVLCVVPLRFRCLCYRVPGGDQLKETGNRSEPRAVVRPEGSTSARARQRR